MARRFVLTGTFSSHNKGDAAMELCATQLLKSAFPDATVVIASPFPERDERAYPGARVVRSRRRQLVRASAQLAATYVYGRLRERLGVRADLLIRHEEVRMMVDADLIIDLSGDMLTEDSGPHVAYSHFLPILHALALGKPVFVCAQSIGPFRMTERLARFGLQRAARITCRDELTREYLARLLPSTDHVLSTGDLAFLLEPAPSHRVDELLGREGVSVGDGTRILGVSTSRLVAARYRRSHRREPGFDVLMAGPPDRILDEHQDLVLLFVPHVTGPRAEHDDRHMAKAIARRMRHRQRCHFIEGDHRPDELKGIIGRCSAFLGARMHANIAALSSCVPCAAIAYSHKTPGIMALFGQEGLTLAVDSITEDDVVRSIRSLLSESTRIRATLASRIDVVRRMAAKNVEIVRELVGHAAD